MTARGPYAITCIALTGIAVIALTREVLGGLGVASCHTCGREQHFRKAA